MFDKFDIKKAEIKSSLGWLVALLTLAGFNADIDHEAIKGFLGEAVGNQITQAGFFFTAAAWVHSSRVKKEIKANFASLTAAINNVAESFREDLKNHSERLDNLSMRVQTVENNINTKKGV